MRKTVILLTIASGVLLGIAHAFAPEQEFILNWEVYSNIILLWGIIIPIMAAWSLLYKIDKFTKINIPKTLYPLMLLPSASVGALLMIIIASIGIVLKGRWHVFCEIFSLNNDVLEDILLITGMGVLSAWAITITAWFYNLPNWIGTEDSRNT